ncbi:MAG: pentapeptide repeat-containing protein [Thermodesulfobacteriota bacterium]
MAETVPTCKIYRKFPDDIYPEIECENTAHPGDPDEFCILHSQNKLKDQDAFNEALLARWNQEGREFYDFRGVFFPDLFNPLYLFGSLKFEKPINFSRASFTGGVYFYQASFAKEADFTGVSFSGEAYFVWASFSGEVDLRGATISGRVSFITIELPFIADFSDLKFQENGVLRFQDMSLAHVRFAGTDLRRPEFHHVTWHPYRGRQALYDEVLLRQRELSLAKKILIFTGLVKPPVQPPPTAYYYSVVERLYRNLQVNYEGVNDYKSSGDFHYGEMEMHRRASKWRWFPLYWYNLYKLSSGYGERPLRAVLVLGGLLLVFSLVLLGLEHIPDVPDKWSWAGFWQALLYVFQQGTLQKPDWLKPATAGGKFLSAFMPVLIPGQAALFFLALRNRLGRRR